MIEDGSGHIDYDESGEGPAVVLVPGSCSTGAAWRPVIAQWANSFRCVTTSLLGYGGNVGRRIGLGADIGHEAGGLGGVIRRAACPRRIVGPSVCGTPRLAPAVGGRGPRLAL